MSTDFFDIETFVTLELQVVDSVRLIIPSLSGASPKTGHRKAFLF